MRFFRSSEVLGIASETLEFALEASRETHPNEYMGLLRGEDARRVGLDRDGTVVTDVLVIPGTEANPISATVKTSMIPNDMRAVGSIHSHPNGVLRPSDADLATFGNGEVHIIVGAPYGRTDWRAFDRDGDPRTLDVLDVDLPDPDEFFDFSQADIDAELADESSGSRSNEDDDGRRDQHSGRDQQGRPDRRRGRSRRGHRRRGRRGPGAGEEL